MKTPILENVKEKQEIALKLRELVTELNRQIHLANKVSLQVRVLQNTGMHPYNSDVSVFINETISY